jgi:hypothetical protein
MSTTDTLVVSEELTVRDGTGAALVPARQLVLTHAPSLLRLPALTEAVGALTEITLDTHPKAKQVLTDVRSARKQAEQHHDIQKSPLNEVRAYALNLEKEDVGAFKALESALSARLLAFETEVERQRKVEQARLQQEAIEKARAEADARAKALRDAAKAEDDAATKRQLNAQARVLKAAPVFVAPVEVESPVVKTSTVTRWSAEITDLEALIVAVAVGIIKRRVPSYALLAKAAEGEPSAPLAALEPERLLDAHPWLNTQATQSQAEFSMPGVMAVSKTGLSGR